MMFIVVYKRPAEIIRMGPIAAVVFDLFWEFTIDNFYWKYPKLLSPVVRLVVPIKQMAWCFKVEKKHGSTRFTG